jgi:hypothetical protein
MLNEMIRPTSNQRKSNREAQYSLIELSIRND